MLVPIKSDMIVQNAGSKTEQLWTRFREDLNHYLERRLPSGADAEDVLQEVFHRIHQSVDRLGDVEHVEGWLYGIARHAVADFYRTRERSVTHASDRLEPGREPAIPGDALSGSHDVHEEVLSWIRPMIDDLPEMYAVPLRMADVDGTSQQQVADALGLSLSGAKSRIQRARAMLGDTLRRCCEVEFGAEGRAVDFRRLRPAEDPCAADQCT